MLYERRGTGEISVSILKTAVPGCIYYSFPLQKRKRNTILCCRSYLFSFPTHHAPCYSSTSKENLTYLILSCLFVLVLFVCLFVPPPPKPISQMFSDGTIWRHCRNTPQIRQVTENLQEMLCTFYRDEKGRRE